jgi:hypothetical protein
MEELLNSFITFLINNKITLTGLLTVLSPILIKLIISKSFRNFLLIGFKHLLKAIFKNTLLAHRFFYNVERYKNTTKKIKFNDIKKTKLFHILLETKLTVVNEEILSWIKINTKILNSNKKLELRNSLETLTFEIVEKYENKIKENYFKYLEDRKEADYFYNLSYEGMCLLSCENYKKNKTRCTISCEETLGFKEYHNNNIAFIERFIETIPECEGESNLQIFNYFLNYIDNALYSAVYDAKKVFTLQNGRYKNYK